MKLLRVAAFFCGVVVVVVVAGGVAWGDRTDPHSCRFDLQRFCSGVDRGGGRRARCLERHYAELTDACKKEVDDRRHQHR